MQLVGRKRTKVDNKIISLEHYIINLKKKIAEQQGKIDQQADVKALQKELEATDEDRAHWKVSICNPNPEPEPSLPLSLFRTF